jgi:HAD superfamily hydrolase (TIGR01490 family)
MNLALFDFDGTITTSDSWTPFMRLSVPRTRILAGVAPLLPVVVGYRIGLVSASAARQASMKAGFRGADAAAVRRLGAEYARTTIPGSLRQVALERIDWHKAQGDRVVVVSGSLDAYLDPWCKGRGLELICTVLDDREGRLTGRLVEGDCVGGEKARRIRERYDLTRYPVVYAYGDTPDDREMLDLAHKKYYRWREIDSWEGVATRE